MPRRINTKKTILRVIIAELSKIYNKEEIVQAVMVRGEHITFEGATIRMTMDF